MTGIKPRICVILHLFYQDLWPEIKNYLLNLKNISDFDLYITLIKENDEISADIISIFSNAKIEIIPNTKGADIYPFIHILNQINLDNYDIIYKLHTKQNIENKYQRLGGIKVKNITYVGGSLWRDFMFSEILGYTTSKKCIEIFKKNLSVGAVGFMPFLISVSDSNHKIFEKPSNLYNIFKNIIDIKLLKKYSFFAGTIFAIRASLLKCIQNKFTIDNFIDKTSQKFSINAYRLEDLLGYVVEAQDYKFSGTNKYSNRIILQLLSNRLFYPLFKFYVDKLIFGRRVNNG